MGDIINFDDYRPTPANPPSAQDLPDDYILHAIIDYIEKRGLRFLTVSRDRKPKKSDEGKMIYYSYTDDVF